MDAQHIACTTTHSPLYSTSHVHLSLNSSLILTYQHVFSWFLTLPAIVLFHSSIFYSRLILLALHVLHFGFLHIFLLRDERDGDIICFRWRRIHTYLFIFNHWWFFFFGLVVLAYVWIVFYINDFKYSMLFKSTTSNLSQCKRMRQYQKMDYS